MPFPVKHSQRYQPGLACCAWPRIRQRGFPHRVRTHIVPAGTLTNQPPQTLQRTSTGGRYAAGGCRGGDAAARSIRGPSG